MRGSSSGRSSFSEPETKNQTSVADLHERAPPRLVRRFVGLESSTEGSFEVEGWGSEEILTPAQVLLMAELSSPSDLVGE